MTYECPARRRKNWHPSVTKSQQSTRLQSFRHQSVICDGDCPIDLEWLAVPSVAVLLSAGGGTRFVGAGHKLEADLRGRPVWRWSLDHLLNAGFDRVIVVTGAVELPLPAGGDRGPQSGLGGRSGRVAAVCTPCYGRTRCRRTCCRRTCCRCRHRRARRPAVRDGLVMAGRPRPRTPRAASSSPSTTDAPGRTPSASPPRCGRCSPPAATRAPDRCCGYIPSGSATYHA